jgi:UDP-3-O-[3-hydroxymyristoyl] glucosamine N-acyltransferase
MIMTVAEIAEAVSGEAVGDSAIRIGGLNSAELATEGELTFAENGKFLRAAEQGLAAAVLVGRDASGSTKPLIRVSNVRVAVAQLLPRFHRAEAPAAGIHPSAVVDPTAEVDPTAHVGPHCVIGAKSAIGARSVLMGGNHVAERCIVGTDVRLYPHVVLCSDTRMGNRVIVHAGTVIGSDGYGYAFDRGRHLKVLQAGNVVIEDDVEIGANAAIDRAAFASTVIGAGTKIDNLVHVAHNVIMGKHCLIMGQCGFAGSTELGDYTVIASQSGVAGHLKLGRQSTVGAKSGVMRDVAAGETVLGIPAMAHQQTKRQWVAQRQLPELMLRLRTLEGEMTLLKEAAARGTVAE